MSEEARKRFGEIAREKGFATEAQVEAGLAEQKDLAEMGMPERIGQILARRGVLTPRQVKAVLAVQKGQSVKRIIEGYEIESKLGQGGMGAVFRARKVDLDRRVALKVLPPRYNEDGPFLQRFFREARLAAQLNHPNIVGCIDTGQSHGHHYIAMEYADGPTLSDILKERGHLPEEEVLDVARQMADALAHAHAKGLIHRDLKPGNIILLPDGTVKLCDMGLAKEVLRRDEDNRITQAGMAVGTPYYISPEQAQGLDRIDGRADLYSLGATLYHLLVGDVPFRASSPAAVLVKHFSEPLVPPAQANPSVSAPVSRLVEILMAKDPRDRFASAEDLRKAVDQVVAGTMPQGPPPRDETATQDALEAQGLSDTLTRLSLTARTVSHEARALGRSRFFVAAALASAAVAVVALGIFLGRRDAASETALPALPFPDGTAPVRTGAPSPSPETAPAPEPAAPEPAVPAAQPPPADEPDEPQSLDDYASEVREVRERLDEVRRAIETLQARIDRRGDLSDDEKQKGRELRQAIEGMEKRLRRYARQVEKLLGSRKRDG